jgi:hypothetical protein
MGLASIKRVTPFLINSWARWIPRKPVAPVSRMRVLFDCRLADISSMVALISPPFKKLDTQKKLDSQKNVS